MRSLLRDQKLLHAVTYPLEKEFEEVVLQNLPLLWTDFYVVPFKALIRTDNDGSRRADLAAVRKDLRIWYVIEVELKSHSFENHIEPQVRGLSQGNYGEEAIAALSKNPALDFAAITKLVWGVPPVVVVVVDSPDALGLWTEWPRFSNETGCKLTFFETFRSDHGEAIFSLSGFWPSREKRKVASLRKDPMLPALRGTLEESIAIKWGQAIEIEIDGKYGTFLAERERNTVLLFPRGDILTFGANSISYDLLVSGETDFIIRKK